MFDKNTIEKFREIPTPFYYYDVKLLKETLDNLKEESTRYGFKLHYAVKANHNERILRIISSYGFGADCVSWNEIDAAIKAGFSPSEIVFAGVGKSDLEILNAIRAGIFCFNCESIPEMEVINDFALKENKIVSIALRINPLIDAHTHKYITTGIAESKFGINTWDLDKVLNRLKDLNNLELIGIHFHVGSQITRLSVFKTLCTHVNELQAWFSSKNAELKVINVGGGLGIDYDDPEKSPEFGEYFSLLREFIELKQGQEIHAEPGRSIVAQCGSLISKVLYIKKGSNTNFAVIDAGMTDLIRPALYQAHHHIENLTSNGEPTNYDVVGPVCESSDTFAKYIELPETKRGDIIAIRSAGAYGEAMASRYNLRNLAPAIFSDEL